MVWSCDLLNRPQNDLYCVEWDVKLYYSILYLLKKVNQENGSQTQNDIMHFTSHFLMSVCGCVLLLLMQKEVSNLKVENRNLKRLLQHQGSSESAYRPIKDGLRSSMSFRERGPTAIRPPDFRLSLAESSGSLCDLPDTKLSLKYSLADLHSSGQCRHTLVTLLVT